MTSKLNESPYFSKRISNQKKKEYCQFYLDIAEYFPYIKKKNFKIPIAMFHDCIDLKSIRRETRFPYPIHNISRTSNLASEVHDSICEPLLGVCLRLSSDQPCAIDMIDGVEYRTRFPHVFLKYPRAHLRFGYTASREVLEIKYSLDVMKLLQETIPFPQKPIWEYTLGTRENAIIAELHNLMEISHQYGIADRIDVLAFELLQLLLLNANGHQADSSPHADTIMKIASFFQLHFIEKLDWDAFLHRYGMSRSTFLRHWKLFFHQSPDQYRLQLKLNEAKRMLREEPHISISDIAQKLNFCEVNYFCAVFKNTFGITPLQWRKNFHLSG